MLDCPWCAKKLITEGLNKYAPKCKQCSRVFRFAAYGERHRQILQPSVIDKSQSDEGVLLSFQWFDQSTHIFGMLMGLWDIATLIIVFYSLRSRGITIDVLLFFLMGIGLTYCVVALYKNSTVISVTHSRVQVQHTPLPWVGGKTVDVACIVQLYCCEDRGTPEHPRLDFSVWAVMKDEQPKRLVHKLKSAEHALYIEQEIKTHLKLS